MWFLIWFILAAFVVFFVGWSMRILFQQKRTWKAFAQKKRLHYEPGTFFGSPSLRGTIDDYPFMFYTDTQGTQDIRGQRFVTVIDVELGEGMPTGAALATKELQPFLDQLAFNETYDPGEPWDPSFLLRARDAEILKAYLDKKRLEVLCGLMKLKNSVVLFFFDELAGVLHIETTDPLRNVEHMEKIVNRLVKSMDVLAPTEEEKRAFKTKAATLKKEEAERELAIAAIEEGTGEGDDNDKADPAAEDAEPEEKPQEAPEPDKKKKSQSSKKPKKKSKDSK